MDHVRQGVEKVVWHVAFRLVQVLVRVQEFRTEVLVLVYCCRDVGTTAHGVVSQIG
jgi:hypothetical protein